MAKKLTHEELEQGLKEIEREALEHKRVGKALWESEEKYRVVFEAAKDAVFLCDEAGRFVDANQAACESLGYSKEELLKLNIDEIDADDRGHEAFLKIRDGLAEQITFEVNQRRKDGGLIPVEITGNFFKIKSQKMAIAIARNMVLRKQAEEALRESKTFSSSLLDNSPNPIIVINPDSSVKYVNRALERLTGFSSAELIDKKAPYPWWAEETLQKTNADLDESMRNGAQKLEQLFQKKGGEKFWVKITSTPVRSDGEFRYYLANWVDITELKQTEQVLRNSQEKLDAMLQSIGDHVSMMDKELNIVWANKIVEKIFGTNIIGKKCYEVYHKRKEPCEPNPCITLKAFQDGKVHEHDTEVVSKDGEKLFFHCTASVALKDENGKPATVIEISRDITEQKQAEEALQETRDYLENLINHANAPIIVWDPEGRITLFNHAFECLTGYAADKVIGEEIHMLFPEEKRDEFLGRISSTLAGEYWESAEIPILCKDGNIRIVLCNSSNIYAEDGKTLLATIAHGIDITDRLQAAEKGGELEALLRQAQKMEALGTLAGGIAHDFNNILGAIIGYTELAQFDAGDSPSLKTKLDKILQAGNRAKNLVKQILAFSRQGEHKNKPIQANLIVKEILELLGASLPTTIEIRQDIQSDAMIMGDPAQIHQILMNLCTNAAHAMSDKGGLLDISMVNVELDSNFVARHPGMKAGPYLQLTVNDTGHGIPPDILDRIFEPFFTTKGKNESTGLGLSVVHGIVKSYGGTIYAYSEPGKGSSFKVYFPAIETRLESGKREKKALPKGIEHVLLVDDEQMLVDVGKQLLESLGYKVTTRTNSTEALELFRSKPERFDVVITDQTMPNMTGVELAKEIMAVWSDIPVILCTGFSTRITQKSAYKMGIRGFLMKPFLLRDLAETVRKVLDE